MAAAKVELLHKDISEADISRISAQVEEHLNAEGRRNRISLTYLKLAFANRRPAQAPKTGTVDKG